MPIVRDDQRGGLSKGGAKAPPPVRAPKQTAAPSSRLRSLKAKLSNERPPAAPAAAPSSSPNRFGGARQAKSLTAFNPREKQVYKAYLDARAAGKQPQFTSQQMQQMGLLPNIAPDYHFDEHGRRLPSDSIATRFVSDFINTTLGAPAVPLITGYALGSDAVTAAKDAADVVGGHPDRAQLPRKTFKDVAKPIYTSFKETATHPGRHPLNSLLNAGAVASLGASALESGAGAAAGAGMARAAGEGALRGAARGARRARGAPIELKVADENGKVTAIRVPRSRSAIVNSVKRARVAHANTQLAKETGTEGATTVGGLKASYGTPQHLVGRHLKRQNELEQQMLEAPAHVLDRYHRKLGLLSPLNRKSLSDAEQKAIDIASTHGREIVGDKQAVQEAVTAHRLYHAHAAEKAQVEQDNIAALKEHVAEALARGDDAAVRRGERALRRAPQEYGLPENHQAQHALAGAAEQHLLNPKPRLKAALEQVPRAIDLREKMGEQLLGKPDRQGHQQVRLSDERQNFRLGARHAELTYGSKGLETPLQELTRLQRDQAELDRLRGSKTGAKVEQLQKLIERVQRVREKRGGPAHAAELTALQRELDAFTKKWGPSVRVLGAKRVNDAVQAAMPATRRFIGENPVKQPAEAAIVPHTLESADAQLAKMQQTYESVLGRYAMGHEYRPGTPLRDQYRLTPQELEEQRYRNTSNGILRKTQKALNEGKRGPKGGSAALRRGFLPNVKDRRLSELESQMHEVLHAAAEKGDEGAQRILAHHERMTGLQNGLSHVREHVAFGGQATPELLAEHLGGRELPVTRAAKDMGATVEETRPRPDLSIGKVRQAEQRSARAGGKLEQFRALDHQEQALKDELNRVVGRNRKGGGASKPGHRLLTLLANEPGRHARVSEIRDELVTSGKLLRDQGAFYLPSRELSDVKKVSAPAFNPSGEGGVGNPLYRHIASLDKEYRAGLERHGVARTDATRLAQESYREMNKAAALDRGFKTLWGMSTTTRDAAGGEHFAIPIRGTAGIPEPLRRLINRVNFHGLTREEEAALPPQELEQLREYLFPHPDKVNAQTNLTADGVPVRWVDSRMVNGLQKRVTSGIVVGHLRGREVTLGKLADVVNQPVRAGLLYTKPAYALNLLQGLGTNALQQGVFLPSNIVRAFRLGRDLGWEDQHRIFSIVGEGSAHALVDERATFLGESVANASHFWNIVVDRLPRVTAFLHEARRMGYSTPQDLHQLLHDEAKRPDLLEVADIANREAIDYSMSAVERQALRRVFFFYPWLRGATLWSLRFPLEHTLQSAAYAPIAQEGTAHTKAYMGEVPSYAEGDTHEFGHTWNLNNLNNFSTLTDVVKGLGSLAQPGSPDTAKLAGEFGPVAGALDTLISGKTSLGHDLPPGESRLQGAASRLVEGQPLPLLVQRVTGKQNAHTNPGKQPSQVPPHGLWNRLTDAVERYTAGGLVPQHPNLPALHAKAETEKVAAMGSRNALIYHSGLGYEQVDKEFPKLAKTLPAGFDAGSYEQMIKHAIDSQRELDLGLRDYARAKGVATSELSGQQKLGVVLNVLERRGLLTDALVKQELSAIAGIDPTYRDDAASKQAEALKHGVGGGAVLAGWKALLEHEGKVKYAGGS